MKRLHAALFDEVRSVPLAMQAGDQGFEIPELRDNPPLWPVAPDERAERQAVVQAHPEYRLLVALAGALHRENVADLLVEADLQRAVNERLRSRGSANQLYGAIKKLKSLQSANIETLRSVTTTARRWRSSGARGHPPGRWSARLRIVARADRTLRGGTGLGRAAFG